MKNTRKYRENDTNACTICSKTTKSGNRVVCDMCKLIYHTKCVPDKHKIHLSEELDIDLFICHLCYKDDDENDEPSFSFYINMEENNSEEVVNGLYQEYLCSKKSLFF